MPVDIEASDSLATFDAVPANGVPHHIQERRVVVFLVLSGLFLGTLGMLNILGISRFVKIFSYHGLGLLSTHILE
jgi:hypothetical protein